MFTDCQIENERNVEKREMERKIETWERNEGEGLGHSQKQI